MTTDEHLDMIVKRCTELLAIAEKRTPGGWCNDPLGTQCIGDISTVDATPIAQAQSRQPLRTPSPDHERIANSVFIASCAGSAEAGWKATISAIETAKYFRAANPLTCEQILNDILAAWPIELLK